MKNVIFVLLILSLAPIAAKAQTLALETLLAELPEAPRAKAFQAEADLSESRAREAENRASWSVFGGADIGHFRELDATAGRVDYTGYGAQLGLSHPLLGSLRTQVENTRKERTAANQAMAEADLARGEHRLAVRLAYTDWWHAQRLEELCASHQTMAERETRVIADRHQNQQLRDSDRLWLIRSWTQHMRDCEAAAALEAEYRHQLEQLTDTPLSTHHLATEQHLPEQLPDPEIWQAALNSHPVIAQRHQEWQVARESDHAWYDSIDARVSLSHRFDQRDDISGTGTGWVAGFSFEMPLQSIGRNADKKQLNKDMARYRWLDTRNNLHNQIVTSVQNYRNQYRDMLFAQEQVDLARLRLWEQRQRENITGDRGFINLRSLTLDLASAERDYLLSKQLTWQSLAQIQLITDFSEDASTTESQPNDTSGWPQAVYIWDSRSLLAENSRGHTLKMLKHAGFNTVYIGLTAEQLGSPDIEERLEKAVTEAKKMDIHSDLLLGDPIWLTEEYRSDLLEILAELSNVNFRNLHLDLEVEQLGWPVPSARLQDWLTTLEIITRNSPWPVSIVAHHRWFTNPEFSEEVCVPCELPRLGIRNASLMIYTTNSERIHELASQAHGRWPELNLYVVQSVESRLPAKNSWHGRRSEGLKELMDQWQDQWQNAGISGMAWQAWQDYPGNKTRSMEEE